MGQIGKGLACQAESEPCSVHNEEPLKVLVWMVAQISTLPHYLRPQPLICFSPRTCYNLEGFYSLVWSVLVSCPTPQLGYEPHEDMDPTQSYSLLHAQSWAQSGPSAIFTKSDLRSENCLLFIEWRGSEGVRVGDSIGRTIVAERCGSLWWHR